MDGLPQALPLDTAYSAQRTLKTPISCVGTGLHSGVSVSVRLCPAEPGTGIVFRRTDLDAEIPARFDHVVDTRLCTVLGLPDRPEARVGTVEHLMAALSGAGIDNARIDIDGPELPAFDGSAGPFRFLIDCAGIATQAEPRAAIEILRPVRVEEGDAFVELRPAGAAAGLHVALSIEFEAPAIGRQALSLAVTPASFRAELADARTFALAAEIDGLRAAGLARGGSLENAVVVDGARVLNPGGLRRPDEFVRHKLLDAVGDLALAGAPIIGRCVAHRSGHALNNRALRTLFADPAAWRRTAPLDWAALPLTAAA